jgi:hypothetical protein
MMLIKQAWNSNEAESGVTPDVDKRSSRVVPLDVPAEAMAWGRDELKQVMVYYYPDRKSKAMRRLL